MTILIADDDSSICTSAAMLLGDAGYDTEHVGSARDAVLRVARGGVSLALIDMNYCHDTTSGMEGLELITALKEQDSELPVIVMTGWSNVSLAVDAMRRGAADFVEKPWQNERLIAIIRTQLDLAISQTRQRQLREENTQLKQALGMASSPIAQSPAMQDLLAQAKKLAGSDIPILITGENGSGKGLLARYIHDHSIRGNAAFLSVNMGGVAENAFESEMYGHVKGAFTDAQADRTGRIELAQGGTLFLDEIANAPLGQQGKLLRLLEEKQYEKLGCSRARDADIRVLSATNADLEAAVKEGRFRQDLLYRLEGVRLHMPSLRDRPEDILPLANRFLTAAAERYQRDDASMSGEAEDALFSYPWPGNVRELQHVLERAVLLADMPMIGADDLQLQGRTSPGVADEVPANPTLEQAERKLIQQALDCHRGQVDKAAKSLGLSRSALYRRLEKHGLST
jgi:DNA-binding NtrC family response regulator